jgi:hypothetical protein
MKVAKLCGIPYTDKCVYVVNGVYIFARTRIVLVNLLLEVFIGLRRIREGIASPPRSLECCGGEILECSLLLVKVSSDRMSVIQCF